MTEMTFAATGDSFITTDHVANNTDSRRLSTLLGDSQVRFTNLETTVHRGGHPPAAESGGAWAVAPPSVLDSIRGYGFNLISWANNHALDYSIGGLLETGQHLEDAGLAAAGAGENLAAASRPRFLETPAGTVALIAVTSTYAVSAAAGAQRSDHSGRPGINPLRFKTVYEIPKEALSWVQRISEETGINAKAELHVELGLRLPPATGTQMLGGLEFREAERFAQRTEPAPNDLARIGKSISEAKKQADYVLVSIHSHEMDDGGLDRPAEFLRTFARYCIESNADAVIGHGPHVLRGIEVYRGRPILYSLGNFIFENEKMETQPADFYSGLGLSAENSVAELFNARSSNDTRGFIRDPRVWRSIIATWAYDESGLTRLELHPITLSSKGSTRKRGRPSLSEDPIALNDVIRLSEEFETSFQIVDGRAVLNL